MNLELNRKNFSIIWLNLRNTGLNCFFVMQIYFQILYKELLNKYLKQYIQSKLVQLTRASNNFGSWIIDLFHWWNLFSWSLVLIRVGQLLMNLFTSAKAYKKYV